MEDRLPPKRADIVAVIGGMDHRRFVTEATCSECRQPLADIVIEPGAKLEIGGEQCLEFGRRHRALERSLPRTHHWQHRLVEASAPQTEREPRQPIVGDV